MIRDAQFSFMYLLLGQTDCRGKNHHLISCDPVWLPTADESNCHELHWNKNNYALISQLSR